MFEQICASISLVYRIFLAVGGADQKSASSTIDCQYAHSKGAKVQLEADVGIQRCCKAGCIDFRKPNTFGRRSHALLHGVVR